MTQAPTRRSPRVLCAEDDSAVAVSLKRTIEALGCEVEWVRTGTEAFARIAEDVHRFDILVTDHEMPDYSGLGLVSKLRDTGYAGEIIVFSAELTDADREVYRSLAVDCILDKPASFKALLDEIRRVAERMAQ